MDYRRPPASERLVAQRLRREPSRRGGPQFPNPPRGTARPRRPSARERCKWGRQPANNRNWIWSRPQPQPRLRTHPHPAAVAPAHRVGTGAKSRGDCPPLHRPIIQFYNRSLCSAADAVCQQVGVESDAEPEISDADIEGAQPEAGQPDAMDNIDAFLARLNPFDYPDPADSAAVPAPAVALLEGTAGAPEGQRAAPESGTVEALAAGFGAPAEANFVAAEAAFDTALDALKVAADRAVEAVAAIERESPELPVEAAEAALPSMQQPSAAALEQPVAVGQEATEAVEGLQSEAEPAVEAAVAIAQQGSEEVKRKRSRGSMVSIRELNNLVGNLLSTEPGRR